MKRTTLYKWLVFALCFALHLGIQLCLMWRVPYYSANVNSAATFDGVGADGGIHFQQHRPDGEKPRGHRVSDVNKTPKGKKSERISPAINKGINL